MARRSSNTLPTRKEFLEAVKVFKSKMQLRIYAECDAKKKQRDELRSKITNPPELVKLRRQTDAAYKRYEQLEVHATAMYNRLLRKVGGKSKRLDKEIAELHNAAQKRWQEWLRQADWFFAQLGMFDLTPEFLEQARQVFGITGVDAIDAFKG